MAQKVITFKKEEDNYYSDPIIPEGTQFVLEIIYKTPGECGLWRRLTEAGDWYFDQFISTYHLKDKVFVTTISGTTPGEQIRLRFAHTVEPTSIKILE